MHEPVVVYEVPVFYSEVSTGVQNPGQGRARIYETAMVILPSNSLPRRFPFSSIKSVNLEGYKVKVSTSGSTVELSRLGNLTQSFNDKLTEAMRKLEASSIETIRAMLPSTSYEELRNLSWLMLEGRAAPRKSVEQISPDLWKRLENNVQQSPLAQTYGYASSLGETSLCCIGLRKTMDVVYVWFLTPVMGSVQSGGNAIVMEVTSETGHATYLFRVMSRTEFPKASRELFAQEAENLIHDLNEATIATGFRREPIYLPEEQLNTPQYGKYLYAAKNLDPLKLLREKFFTRVIHNTFEQWKDDLNQALLFNTSASEDSARWSRATEMNDEQLVPASPTDEYVQPPAPVLQSLNVKPASNQSMPERVLVLRTMEADDRGNVKLWLHDGTLEHDTAIMITGEEAGKLAAFPGAKIKVSLEKA
jgi:hypothetical protein